VLTLLKGQQAKPMKKGKAGGAELIGTKFGEGDYVADITQEANI